MSKSNKTEGKSKIKFSIVFKLNSKLILRMLGIFISLDIFLLLVFGLFLIVNAEHVIAESIATYNISSQQKNEYIGIISVSKFYGNPTGFKPPAILKKIFPPSTFNGYRKITWDKNLENLKYHILLNEEQEPIKVTINLEYQKDIFKYIILAVIFWQIITLINSISSGAGIIRSTLRPISELAETAKSLNNSKSTFSPEEMEKLKGKLEMINPSRLDTRISIEGTHYELQGLAQAINGMLDRINAAYKSQIRFVSDASHELRTPISVIQGYANLLDRWGKNDEKALQESITAIKEEAANMKILVEQLLFLARGDNNTMTIQMTEFDVSELAKEVVKETKMIDTSHDFDSTIQSVYINADEGLIKQAFRILIDNAIKYTEPGGKIKVQVEEKEGKAMLIVSDEGIGIPPEDLPKIFDRFYRTDESRARSTGGTGLGLSIANWICERHGGHMEVISRVGIGTKISIVLPAVSKDLIAANTNEGNG